MKTYINPQPQAVSRINKAKNLSDQSEAIQPQELNQSSKEIYKNESEEQAWRDVLKKDKI